MKESMLKLLRRCDEWMEAHRAEYIADVQKLVRVPSVSRADLAQEGAPFGPDCRKMLDAALAWGREYGFEAEDLNGLAGSITWNNGKEALGIIAHMDVVPVGDGWVYPPFGGTYLPEHDVIIGRGVGDNKGPAVAGLFAMRMLREFGYPMRHSVKLICGLSEETGMEDMQGLGEKGYEFPKLSLVPDAAFPVNYAQKGSVDVDLTSSCEGNLLAFDAGSVRNVIPDLARCVLAADVKNVQEAFARLDEADTAMLTVTACEQGTLVEAHGRSGHAARPETSDNAIQRLAHALTLSGLLRGSCAQVIRQVDELTADSFGQSEGVAYADEASGPLTLVYGVAHLKDGVLTLLGDCRYSISLQGDELAAKLKAHWTARGFAIADFGMTYPFYIPKEDPRVQALQELYREVTGQDDPPYTMGGGTYSRVVPNAISFGPGIPGKVWDRSFLPEGHGGGHGRDETVNVESILTCSKIYAAALVLLDELCTTKD